MFMKYFIMLVLIQIYVYTCVFNIIINKNAIIILIHDDESVLVKNNGNYIQVLRSEKH